MVSIESLLEVDLGFISIDEASDILCYSKFHSTFGNIINTSSFIYS